MRMCVRTFVVANFSYDVMHVRVCGLKVLVLRLWTLNEYAGMCHTVI